jgi:hypothetical protein
MANQNFFQTILTAWGNIRYFILILESLTEKFCIDYNILWVIVCDIWIRDKREAKLKFREAKQKCQQILEENKTAKHT